MFSPPIKKCSYQLFSLKNYPLQTFSSDVDTRTVKLPSYFHEKNKGLTWALMSRVLWRVVGSRPTDKSV